MAVLCGMIGMPFIMRGTRTLRIKETDRILALQHEMKKFGIQMDADPEGDWIKWDGLTDPGHTCPVQIKTYQDHRMAMAFSPAAMKQPGIDHRRPRSCKKILPGFLVRPEINWFQSY